MMKQFVPQESCLKCQGCCRFSQQNSLWAPCLLDEEIQDLLDRDIPPVSISMEKRICPIPHPSQEGFVCPFFNIQENKCKIYDFRPFECQLYPFLINFRNKKALLTVDLNCPYIKDNLNTKALGEYTDYLIHFLNSKEQLNNFRNSPQIIQAYEEVLDIIELQLPGEIK